LDFAPAEDQQTAARPDPAPDVPASCSLVETAVHVP